MNNTKEKGTRKMISTVLEPHVYKITDNDTSLLSFKENLEKNTTEEIQDIILYYPTVYIHNWKDSNEYEVYIGESNNILQRTRQHYSEMGNLSSWQHNLQTHNADLYIIGHKHFNKSLTLDIENRLMLYLMSVDKVRKIHNKKCNPQNKYYPCDEFDSIFQKVWTELRKMNATLFPVESTIKDSAVFKASPLHKLTSDQEGAKELLSKR